MAETALLALMLWYQHPKAAINYTPVPSKQDRIDRDCKGSTFWIPGAGWGSIVTCKGELK